MAKMGHLTINCPAAAHDAVRKVVEASELGGVFVIKVKEHPDYKYGQARISAPNMGALHDLDRQWTGYYRHLQSETLVPIIENLCPDIEAELAGRFDYSFCPEPRRGGEAQPQKRNRVGR